MLRSSTDILHWKLRYFLWGKGKRNKNATMITALSINLSWITCSPRVKQYTLFHKKLNNKINKWYRHAAYKRKEYPQFWTMTDYPWQMDTLEIETGSPNSNWERKLWDTYSHLFFIRKHSNEEVYHDNNPWIKWKNEKRELNHTFQFPIRLVVIFSPVFNGNKSLLSGHPTSCVELQVLWKVTLYEVKKKLYTKKKCST